MNPSVVTFHYTLRNPSGRVLDTSVGAEPVTYLEGAGQIIDGLDEQLRGAAAGLKIRIQVPAARAYGDRDASQGGKRVTRPRGARPSTPRDRGGQA